MKRKDFIVISIISLWFITIILFWMFPILDIYKNGHKITITYISILLIISLLKEYTELGYWLKEKI
jgi:hypothetical protein